MVGHRPRYRLTSDLSHRRSVLGVLTNGAGGCQWRENLSNALPGHRTSTEARSEEQSLALGASRWFGVPATLWLALGLLGVILSWSVIPGVFTVDEPNYLTTLIALREGRISTPGTDGLPPSRELAWFDPAGASRAVTATPVAPTAPPLWAFFAWPLSGLGWHGLVLLNTLAFLATAVLVYILAENIAGKQAAGWWAATSFVLGGFGLEYAQALWPHSLSVALVFSAALCAHRAATNGCNRHAAAAGLLAGIATGIRYPNAVSSLALLIFVAVSARARVRLCLERALAFAVGLLVPLLASAAINYARFGTFNPITKGPDYLRPRSGGANLLVDAATMLWARLIDYSARPDIPSGYGKGWMFRSIETGAWIVSGEVKKALLQSAPWIASAMVLALLLLTTRHTERSARFALQSLLVAGSILGAFSLAGRGRDDGLCFNQRYLLEIVPFAAVLFGVLLSSLPFRRSFTLLGCALGTVAAASVVTFVVDETLYQMAILYLPLLLAVALVVSAFTGRRYRLDRLSAPLAAACLGWALVVHLDTDLERSRQLRAANAHLASLALAVLPDHSAVITWAGSRDFLGAVALEKPIVVANAAYDQGDSAPELATALLAQGRPVFVWTGTMPQPILASILRGRRVLAPGGTEEDVPCVEIR
jgi:hypothetical protein